MLISVITLALTGAFLAADGGNTASGSDNDRFYRHTGTVVYSDGSDTGKSLLFMSYIDFEKFKKDYAEYPYYLIITKTGAYEFKVSRLHGNESYTESGTVTTNGTGEKVFSPASPDKDVSAVFDGEFVVVTLKLEEGRVEYKFSPLP
ncbi:MAG: hypothetical protein LBC13_00675 [Clostridiales bacterium]|nr:hypothetical protein [Clostridiales bacterium]